MSIKGQTVDVLSGAAAAGPWSPAFEKALVSFAHKYPTNRTVLSFCRHFGEKLIDREGDAFSRVAVFETGGKMVCAGDRSLAQISLLYYFIGNINGQHEDEQGVARMFKALTREGDIFFDLGANFGFYSSFVLPLCGKSGQVHSFEANPSLYPHLRRLSEANARFGGIRLNEMAVGKDAGATLPFYGTDRIGCSSLYPHEWLNHDSVIHVPVITIDEYVRKNGVKRIDAMKIDIEGAELDALMGMEETLRTCAPKLITCELTLMPEYNDPMRKEADAMRATSAADPRRVAGFLADRGYILCHIPKDGKLRVGKLEDLRTNEPIQLINVAFVRPELRTSRPELFSTN